MENKGMSIERIELSEDVMMDILSRIPAKSLLRFKSVSKYWYSLIQNPYFISLHHSRAQPYDCISTLGILNIDPDYTSMNLLLNQTSIQDLDLSFITPPLNEKKWLYGSCNGLVCLTNGCSIVICNPAISEFRVLPQPPYGSRQTSYLGFGFDPKSNDYKVVRVATLYESNLKPYNSYYGPFEEFDLFDEKHVTPVDHKILVYGMSSNSWKKIVAVVPNDYKWWCHMLDTGCCISLDGVFYWLAKDVSTTIPVIHTFCVFEELFERIPFPDVIVNKIVEQLCILQNSLAIVLFEFDHKLEGSRFDVWVMDEYKVMESWTKRYTVGPLLGIYCSLGFRPNIEVLFVSRSFENIVSYNLSSGDINEYNQLCGRPGAQCDVQVLAYSESLISVKIRVD